MLKIFDPPQSIEPQDVSRMEIAGILCDAFTNTALAEAEDRGIQSAIKATLGQDARRKITRIAAQVDTLQMTPDEGEFALAHGLNIFLNDIFLAAALDHIPEDVITRNFPVEYATEEWADLYERYDMYTTARFVRFCMWAKPAP